MKITSRALSQIVEKIFHEVGCGTEECAAIARHLVEANLVGHDSHGVIRIPAYVTWVKDGKMIPNQSISTVLDTGSLAVVDGNSGFGQIIGEQAVDLGIEKCREHGIAIVGLRNSGHVGRVGDWAIRAADAGIMSLHFVNTSGGGILVAPFGGTDRRLSANPIAVGVPVSDGQPMILDMSTCVIAEGKIRVARNKGVHVPDDAILDGHGEPTTDPEAFYADPPGAILTIAGHKGFGLSVICEVLAGALTRGGCSNPDNPTAKKVVNGMLSIYIDHETMAGDAYDGEISRLVDWVKASPKEQADGQILMPGEIEEQTKAARMAEGIPLDDLTWTQLMDTATAVGLDQAALGAIAQA